MAGRIEPDSEEWHRNQAFKDTQQKRGEEKNTENAVCCLSATASPLIALLSGTGTRLQTDTGVLANATTLETPCHPDTSQNARDPTDPNPAMQSVGAGEARLSHPHIHSHASRSLQPCDPAKRAIARAAVAAAHPSSPAGAVSWRSSLEGVRPYLKPPWSRSPARGDPLPCGR